MGRDRHDQGFTRALYATTASPLALGLALAMLGATPAFAQEASPAPTDAEQAAAAAAEAQAAAERAAAAAAPPAAADAGPPTATRSS